MSYVLKRTGPLAVAALALGISLPAAGTTCPASCEWGYGPGVGPATWGATCCPVCDGASQSPIDIRPTDASAGDLGPLRLNYRESHLELSNDGRTLVVTDELEPGANYLELGDRRWDLTQFHFHSLSEHTIDGEHFPLEIHFVHRRTSYDLAVIAVMVEEGPRKPAFNPLWNSLPADESVAARTVILNPRRLIPGQLAYYTYRGSLTEPDCAEVVTWFVLRKPVPMSSEQIEAFRAIFESNYRPVQPLNGRSVLTGE
ncbi:MAG: carbonic anhydrase family protein [Acidobacteria bacterium]|nr:carbonic anhydrase family protein [Acidobacteriota bacterium]